MGMTMSSLFGAEAGEGGGLLAKCRYKRSAEWESDNDADRNAGAGEHLDGSRHPDRIDHGTGKAIADGFVAENLNLFARGLGLQQSVIDNLGERLPG